MSNDDDLSPDIVTALRDVGPVDETVREAHIGRALAELGATGARGTTQRRWSMISAAAAAVVALSVGVVLGRSTGEPDVVVRNAATETVVTTTSVPPKASTECADEIDGETFIGTWTDDGTEKFITSDARNFYVRDATTCAVLETIARD